MPKSLDELLDEHGTGEWTRGAARLVALAWAEQEGEALRAAIRDIDAHATPVGLLDENDPEGSPAHYRVTTGALHRALGKVGCAAKCEAEAELSALRERVKGLVEALGRIINDIPACSPDGGLFVEHHDGEGNWIGSEQVDPAAVIGSIVGVARDALAAAAWAVEPQKGE